ncbi:hypothetical protein LguiB_008567 [Lonicera macranthoides]
MMNNNNKSNSYASPESSSSLSSPPTPLSPLPEYRIEWVVGRCCCFCSWPPLVHNFQSNNLTIKQRID